MGREVRRVALDFDWPIGEVWPGFLIQSVCQAVDEDCERCQRFYKLMGWSPREGILCPDFNLGPPAGEGYQIWETTSEGSPISPVFATPEELARWLADTGASSFGSETASYETWLKFIRGPGWAPSAMICGGVFSSGVEAVVADDE